MATCKQKLNLWNGDVIPVEHSGEYNEIIKSEVGKIEKTVNSIEKLLDQEQLILLHDLIDHYENYMSSVAEQAFCDGFCYAYRLSVEALCDNKKKTSSMKSSFLVQN